MPAQPRLERVMHMTLANALRLFEEAFFHIPLSLHKNRTPAHEPHMPQLG